jgi:Xaa-Pro aminopeptidase
MDSSQVVKTKDEIDRLRRVAKLTDEVFSAIIPSIREGVAQPQLEDEIRMEALRLGAQDVSFPPAVIFTKTDSPPSTEAFVYPREDGLVPGTSIAFDFGFVLDGYCSDFGRSLYFGRAPEHIRGAYKALQQAVVDTVASMRVGAMRVCDLYPAVERTLDRLGYGDYLRARLKDKVLGHAIGRTVHEEPWINPACELPLRAGMVFALEPKLWHSGQYYLRVEDMVLVGRDSSEFLTTSDRTTFEL